MRNILIFAFSLVCLNIFSQIKVVENIVTEPKENRIVLAYDSIYDFRKEKTGTDYIKYVREELFLPPLRDKELKSYPTNIYSTLNLKYKNQKLILPDTIVVLNDEDRNNKIAIEIKNNIKEYGIYTDTYMPYYSIILSHQTDMFDGMKPGGYESNISIKTAIFNKKYKIAMITDVDGNHIFSNNTGDLKRIRVWLETPEKDTIYFDKEMNLSDTSLSPFLISGFYEFHKNYYINKDVIYFKQPEIDWEGNPKNFFVDIQSGEKVIPQFNEYWFCADILFLNIQDSPTYTPYYILGNKKNLIRVKLGDMIESGFITQDLLDKYILLQQMENQQ